jgi:gamma-glutamyl-gamma-aminobutyrate hydrolase PuuD
MVEPNTPLIAITTGSGPDWEEAGRHFEPYAEAVRAAGGAPIRLAPGGAAGPAEILARVRGLLLAGGPDVDLREFPSDPPLATASAEELMEQRRMRTDRARDRLELPLVPAAIAAGVPVLGICRGCQVLNVGLGGELILDIPSERPKAIVHTANPPPGEESAQHQVEIAPASRLAAALGFSGRQPTNSRHHQAVLPCTAPGVHVVADCPDDGIVEAIELPDATWAIGVQWHPESARDPEVRARFANLFRSFVSACAGR